MFVIKMISIMGKLIDRCRGRNEVSESKKNVFCEEIQKLLLPSREHLELESVFNQTEMGKCNKEPK